MLQTTNLGIIHQTLFGAGYVDNLSWILKSTSARIQTRAVSTVIQVQEVALSMSSYAF